MRHLGAPARLRIERVRERDAYVLLSVTDETGNGVVRTHRRYVEPLDS